MAAVTDGTTCKPQTSLLIAVTEGDITHTHMLSHFLKWARSYQPLQGFPTHLGEKPCYGLNICLLYKSIS